MASLLDNETLPLRCHCGRITKKRIGWIKTHRQPTCVCGRVLIDITPRQFLRAVRKAEAAMANVRRGLK